MHLIYFCLNYDCKFFVRLFRGCSLWRNMNLEVNMNECHFHLSQKLKKDNILSCFLLWTHPGWNIEHFSWDILWMLPLAEYESWSKNEWLSFPVESKSWRFIWAHLQFIDSFYQMLEQKHIKTVYCNLYSPVATLIISWWEDIFRMLTWSENFIAFVSGWLRKLTFYEKMKIDRSIL